MALRRHPIGAASGGRRSQQAPRQDPDDVGNLPQQLIASSCVLAKLLRHGGGTLTFDSKGYCKVPELLNHAQVRATGLTISDVKIIVSESFSKDRPRFHLDVRNDALWIRAEHKRTVVPFNEDAPQDDEGTLTMPTILPLSQEHNSYSPSPPSQDVTSGGGMREVFDPWVAGIDPWNRDSTQAGSVGKAPAAKAMPRRQGASPDLVPGPKAPPPILPRHDTQTKDCDGKLTGSIGSVCPSQAIAFRSSTGRLWSEYTHEEQGVWWSCDDNDFFVVASTDNWKKYEDPKSRKPYWCSDATSEFFFVDFNV